MNNSSDQINKPLFGFRNLIAWQKADELAHLVYDLTLTFPKDEIYGLTSQLRRAILSVPTNIVEGYSRNSKKEFHRYLVISLGSLAEATYLLEFGSKRGYINSIDYEKIISLKEEVGRILWKLYISQKENLSVTYHFCTYHFNVAQSEISRIIDSN